MAVEYGGKLMADLVPNTPQKRIDYVVKTYRGTKNDLIIPDVVAIAFHTVGLDALGREWETAIGWPLSQYYYNGDPTLLFSRWREWSGGDNPHGLNQALYDVYSSHWASSSPSLIDSVVDPEAYASDLLDAALGAIHWPTRHPLDFIIPWTARELGSLAKAVRRGTASREDDYLVAVQHLRASATAIAMWSKENRIDLTKTSLAEALEAIKDFEVEVDVEPAEVVHTFEDGFTLQKLTTPAQLEQEGEAMQHCVAAYCEPVDTGRAEIYSLRDANSKPHATLEWDPLGSAFVQVEGKQNTVPVEKYRPYLREVIVKMFGSDIAGLLGSGIDPRDALMLQFATSNVLRGVDLGAVDVPERQDAAGVWHTHIDLDRFDLSGTFVDDVSFQNASLKWAKFVETHLMTVDFEGVDLQAADFREADISGSYFLRSILTDAEFRRAKISGSDFTLANMSGVVFDGAKISETSFDGAKMQGASMEGVTIDEDSYKTIRPESQFQGIDGVNWYGAMVGNVSIDAHHDVWPEGDEPPDDEWDDDVDEKFVQHFLKGIS